MEVLSIVRYILYAISWVWNTVVFGATSDKLKGEGGCAFGSSGKCDTIIAFGVIAWLILSTVIILRLLSTFMQGKIGLPERWEFLIFSILAVWWLVVAIIASTGLNSQFPTKADNTVVAFSWMLIFLMLGLAAIAFIKNRRGDAYDVGTAAPAPPPEV